MIYLDHAATSPLNREILDTFVQINQRYFANTSSAHKLGFEVGQLEKQARLQIARLMNFKENEVIFTSGATESNNLAIKGIALRYQNRGKHLITSSGEHASVLNSFRRLEEEYGFRVTYLPLNAQGKIDVAELEKAIDEETILVSLMGVNNEVGSINEIGMIGKMLKRYPKIFFHVDATQTIGKVDVDYENVDLISFSAHKINGFKGSGALLKRERADLLPLLNGGGQEFTYRSGTTNFPYEVCLAKALRIALENQKERYAYVKRLSTSLKKRLSRIDGVGFNSPEDASPYIVNFSVGKKASVVSEALSNREIYVSTQSACSSKKASLSHVLKAMGKSDRISENSIRVSLSYLNDEAEIQTFADTLEEIVQNIK